MYCWNAAGISAIISSVTAIMNLPHSIVLQIWKINFYALIISWVNVRDRLKGHWAKETPPKKSPP